MSYLDANLSVIKLLISEITMKLRRIKWKQIFKLRLITKNVLILLKN